MTAVRQNEQLSKEISRGFVPFCCFLFDIRGKMTVSFEAGPYAGKSKNYKDRRYRVGHCRLLNEKRVDAEQTYKKTQHHA